MELEDLAQETSAEIPEHKPTPTSVVEITCEGDRHLDEIVEARDDSDESNPLSEETVVGVDGCTPQDCGIIITSLTPSETRTENECWIHLKIFPGNTTMYEWVMKKLRAFITCAPIRKLVRCCCLYDGSENSSDRSVTYEFEMNRYMALNPDFLQEHVINSTPLDVIERLYIMKMELEQRKSPVVQNTQELVRMGQSEFQSLFGDLKEETTEDEFIFKLTDNVSAALSGRAFRLYKVYPEGHVKLLEICSANYVEPQRHRWTTATDVDTQCLEAIRRKSILMFTRVTDPLDSSKQPKTIFYLGDETLTLINEILVPVYGENAEVVYLMDIWRFDSYFGCTDLALSETVWASVCFNYFIKWMNQRRQNELNKVIMDSVKSTFEDVMSINQVVEHTLQYAQKLVDADRASLFMVDRENQELVSRVFDLRGDDTDALGQPKEIRIPMARGIAGHVASTGETVNIANAYADERFNDEVDEATGYCTTSILCMPVKVDRKVIGVVQMVNKRSADKFSSEDETSFNIFSAFFGLALHNAGIYDMIARNEQKYRVALDVLSYHNTCREHEMHELQKLEPLPPEVDLDNFYLDPFKFNPLEKCQAVMIMFNDLFSLKNFDHSSLTRFVLTVKKNYREVPYHNFHHGWSVAQSMYAILKADTVGRFSYKQRLALFVASLCHDLDHRGYTNKYMSETASPLASMYTTSTLEHHHFSITVTILQQDGHNIFDRFTSEEYKDMLGLIKTCILATDLAAFFPNLAQLEIECKGNYDWSNNEHSKLAMALSMTAADLSAAAKPWDIQIETVKVIFQEFYDQGDKERKAGRPPIPMMDRDKPQKQPACQVGFITSICLPCYRMLQYLLPGTDKMFRMAARNLEIWHAKTIEAADRSSYRISEESTDEGHVLQEFYVSDDESSGESPANQTTNTATEKNDN